MSRSYLRLVVAVRCLRQRIMILCNNVCSGTIDYGCATLTRSMCSTVSSDPYTVSCCDTSTYRYCTSGIAQHWFFAQSCIVVRSVTPYWMHVTRWVLHTSSCAQWCRCTLKALIFDFPLLKGKVETIL